MSTPRCPRSCSRRSGSRTRGTPPQSDAPTANAIDPSTITLNGAPVVATASYRVTVNSFLATGGDGFGVLNEGTDRLGGAVDLDALEDYLTATPGGVAPGPRDRISRVG